MPFHPFGSSCRCLSVVRAAATAWRDHYHLCTLCIWHQFCVCNSVVWKIDLILKLPRLSRWFLDLCFAELWLHHHSQFSESIYFSTRSVWLSKKACSRITSNQKLSVSCRNDPQWPAAKAQTHRDTLHLQIKEIRLGRGVPLAWKERKDSLLNSTKLVLMGVVVSTIPMPIEVQQGAVVIKL